MKSIAIFCMVFLCLTISVQASDILDKEWFQGEVVLRNGEIIRGEIQYDLEGNVAMVRQGDMIKAYSPYNVDYFKFLDSERKTIRSFYTMPYSNGTAKERLMFFELIFHDGFALFNREEVVRKKEAMNTNRPFIESAHDEEEVTVFSYYIFTEDGNFQQVKTEEYDLYEKLALSKRERKDLQKFIYENGLDLKSRSDFIRVIHRIVHQDREEDNQV